MDENQVSNPVNASTSTDSSAAIADLIQSIQTKLNNEQTPNIDNNYQAPEDNTISKDTQESTNNNFDFSAIGSLLKNVDISSVLGLLGGNSNTSSNSDKNSGFGLGDIDPKIFIKIQRILGSLKQDDPKKDLLRSLKPFLRKSRQDKLGEYITILSIVNAIGIFNDKGSDKDV